MVMRQRWTDLLFLHWTLPPEKVRRTLPPGLTVDLFEEKAWVGVVPFFMKSVRPVGLPSVQWLSHFLELNVRTNVRDGRVGLESGFIPWTATAGPPSKSHGGVFI